MQNNLLKLARNLVFKPDGATRLALGVITAALVSVGPLVVEAMPGELFLLDGSSDQYTWVEVHLETPGWIKVGSSSEHTCESLITDSAGNSRGVCAELVNFQNGHKAGTCCIDRSYLGSSDASACERNATIIRSADEFE